jgi:predicted dehydrogenase
VGLIGAGRLGRVYARDLASRIAETKLVAIADPVESVAKEIAAEFDVAKCYADPLALIDDPAVDAIVIVSPTHTHREIVMAAAGRKKPTFCEKPPALSLDEVAAMQDAIASSGMFFQMGFMRRFDAGYASAKKQIDEGRIGTPLVFKSTSRDPFRPSLEYANPKSSGGMLIDMGIHDFDLARWFMGEVRTVSTIGATIAYPELATVGRSEPERHLRLRHLDGDSRPGRDAEDRLPARDAGDADDEELGVARHGAVFHGAVPRRVHDAAPELRAERAAGADAADHDRGRHGGAAHRRRRDARARDRPVGRRGGDQGIGGLALERLNKLDVSGG